MGILRQRCSRKVPRIQTQGVGAQPQQAGWQQAPDQKGAGVSIQICESVVDAMLRHRHCISTEEVVLGLTAKVQYDY